MSLSAARSTRWTIPLLVAAVAALTLVAVLLVASSARAAEYVYWNNYHEEPGAIGFANIDGSGGGAVGGATFLYPEGMAYDPVTNRLYTTAGEFEPGERKISYVNLDGSGGGVLTAPGALVEEADGLAIDPTTRTVFWLNDAVTETIGWARLDGSAGGVLNTTGATFSNAYRLALDPVAGRVYWGNNNGTIGYANTNNTGGGMLNTTGAPPFSGVNGLTVDNASGRLYWIDTNTDNIAYASLNGSGGGQLGIGTALFEGPYGLALEPSQNRLYWGNEQNGTTRTEALGFVNIGSETGGGVTISTAFLNGPQDPVIIKSPTGTGAPQVTQSQAQLSCSQGSWATDASGGNFFQSPRTYAYQWSLNGSAISGATASTYTATAPGSYGCTVTATNQAGSAQQSGASSVTVTAATLQATAKKKKAKAKPGKKVTFVVNLANQGNLASAAGKACFKLPNKKAKKALKPQKCASVGALAAGAGASVKLGLKIKNGATPGSYKVTITVPGTSGIKVSVKVLNAGKPHHKK